MGSFQQIIMGVGCLIAAFWFGSILQDRPAGQNQTAQLLPDGTIDPNRAVASPNLMERTKGFLDSMFQPPSKAKPITVADLREHSQSKIPSLPNLVDHNSNYVHGQASPENLAGKNFANENQLKWTDETRDAPDPQRLVGSFQSVTPIVSPAKVAIVPDFSSLAEEVNRGLSFNNGIDNTNSNRVENRPANSESGIELIPVPKFSDVGTRRREPIADPDWEVVREQVAAAEDRLKSYRDQMTQPIPEIVESVNQRTQEFWDRQQSEARRKMAQPSRLAASETLDQLHQRRLKPETWSEKEQRWDVFSNNRDGRTYQRQTQNQPAAKPIEVTRAGNYDRSHAHASVTQPRPKPSIVEINRPFIAQQPVAQRPVAQPPVVQRQQPPTHSSARVRSLNDDRSKSFPQPADPASERVAYNTPPQPIEMQNQLRPRYNPNAGSKPEFVSPPDYGLFQSRPKSTSEIVEAAKVTYGSFREYETQPQDTLQTISEKFYGSADYYFDLYLANRDLLSNPATVPAGVTIKIPKFDAR